MAAGVLWPHVVRPSFPSLAASTGSAVVAAGREYFEAGSFEPVSFVDDDQFGVEAVVVER
ncbi:hypothetical protein [Nocardia veterana]|uniref:Uncharacterized protein n=1 Tax=Nocardia veterana TaxID=132249 RepID=A0A7X6M1B5_9NOCA|nr:hypothetical protein [Nocardia veterana]NKY87580.1 hypothetical protein [Nocardia veterana]